MKTAKVCAIITLSYAAVFISCIAWLGLWQPLYADKGLFYALILGWLGSDISVCAAASAACSKSDEPEAEQES